MAYPIGAGTTVQATLNPPQINLEEQLITALQTGDEEALDQIFDNPQAQMISSETLGEALVISIQKSLFQGYGPELLNLQNANAIPDDEWGFGHAVLMAIHTRNFDALQYLQRTAGFGAMSPNGDFGLGQALLSEVMHLIYIYEEGGLHDTEIEYLNILIRHPNAHQIGEEVPSLYGMDELKYKVGECQISQKVGMDNLSNQLGILLRHAAVEYKEVNSIPIMQALLHPNLAHLLETNGRFGLGRALAHAAYCSDLVTVQALLAHTYAPLINSDPTPIPLHKTSMETDDYPDLSQYGLTEAIYLAISSDVHTEPNREAIVNALLAFAETHYLVLRISDDFGLKEACEIAEEEGNVAIAQRLRNIISEADNL